MIAMAEAMMMMMILTEDNSSSNTVKMMEKIQNTGICLGNELVHDIAEIGCVVKIACEL